MLEFLVKCLVVYVLACLVWSSFFVVRNLDELQETAEKSLSFQYHVFMAGIIWVILISPFWVPKIISGYIVDVVKAIREIKV